MSTQIAVMVRITLPPGMSPEQATEEIKGSIEFGKPEVQFMYVLETES